MTFGIRAQVLFALAAMLGFGLLASYYVTTGVTRNAITDAEIFKARQNAELAAERFATVPTGGLAAAEALAQIRPLLAPAEVVLLGADLRVVADPPEVGAAFFERIGLGDLASLRARDVRHIRINADAPGGGTLFVLAPISREGRPNLAPSDPTDLCLIVPLSAAVARLENVEELFLLFIATILAMALLLGYVLLGRLVFSPVFDLLKLIQRIEQGGLGRYSGRGSGPRPRGELGELHDAFHRLAGRLSDDRTSIQRHMQNLKQASEDIESAQQQLVMAEKLATVGQLAAGVAHEIGNPIAILQGYLELLAEPDLDEATRQEQVAIMQSAVDRIAVIIRDLLDFARPEAAEEPFCDAVQICRTALKLIGPQKRFQNLTVVLAGGEAPAYTAAHGGRLEQVLLNLLFNAADASPEGGTITVSVAEQDEKVILTVADEGSGLSRGDMVKVFDPFYTTKDPGDGTGLGLAISHSIANSYGGTIHVRSEAGEGAAFSIILPAANPGA